MLLDVSMLQRRSPTHPFSICVRSYALICQETVQAITYLEAIPRMRAQRCVEGKGFSEQHPFVSGIGSPTIGLRCRGARSLFVYHTRREHQPAPKVRVFHAGGCSVRELYGKRSLVNNRGAEAPFTWLRAKNEERWMRHNGARVGAARIKHGGKETFKAPLVPLRKDIWFPTCASWNVWQHGLQLGSILDTRG